MQKKNSKHMFYKSYALVIIITGEKTIAKKGGGACDREVIQKRIPCEENRCKAECFKRNKLARAACEGYGRPEVCVCHHQDCPPP